MSRFYIGQKIVCIEGHEYAFKKGDEFNVYGLKSCGCGCGTVVIDIGVRHESELMCCGASGRLYPYDGHYRHTRFAPIETISESTEWSESLIKELETEINEENLILK